MEPPCCWGISEMRLTKALFPTFGRPIIATSGSFFSLLRFEKIDDDDAFLWLERLRAAADDADDCDDAAVASSSSSIDDTMLLLSWRMDLVDGAVAKVLRMEV